MDRDQLFWIFFWAIVAVAIVAVVSILVYNNQETNERIRTATSCEQAVLIYGGPQVDTRLMLCAVGKKP
jgi:hypothetical protein